MNLSMRLRRIELTQSPQGRVFCFPIADTAEASVLGEQMRGSGEIGPDDTVFFLVTGVSRPTRRSSVYS